VSIEHTTSAVANLCSSSALPLLPLMPSADQSASAAPLSSSAAPALAPLPRAVPRWKSLAAELSAPAATAAAQPERPVQRTTQPPSDAYIVSAVSVGRSQPVSAAGSSTLRIGVLALQGAFVEHVASLQQLAATLLQERQLLLDITLVRTGGQLLSEQAPLHGLIIPGGESTVMRRLLAEADTNENLIGALRTFIAAKRPVFGTCAGCILLADRIMSDAAVVEMASEAGSVPAAPTHPEQQSLAQLGGLDIAVARNYYGRQLASFTTDNVELRDKQLADSVSAVSSQQSLCPGVFIRAPAIVEHGPGVRVLATLAQPDAHRRPVLAAPAHLAVQQPQQQQPSAQAISASPVAVAVRSDSLLATCFHPELTNDLRWHRYFVEMCAEKASQ